MQLKKLMYILPFCGLLAMTNAFAEESPDDFGDEVVSNITHQTPSTFCAKASLLNLKFSIRSGSGMLCGKIPAISALIAAYCIPRNTDNFLDSHCYKALPEKYRDKTGEAGAKIIGTVIKNGISKAPFGEQVRKIACTLSQKGAFFGSAGSPNTVEGIIKNACADAEKKPANKVGALKAVGSVAPREAAVADF